jgi:hypothetical protein
MQVNKSVGLKARCSQGQTSARGCRFDTGGEAGPHFYELLNNQRVREIDRVVGEQSLEPPGLVFSPNSFLWSREA